jgi:hypothetical protein
VAHPVDPYLLFGNLDGGYLRRHHRLGTIVLRVRQRMPQGLRCAKAKQVLL